jgi:Holliday junction resolvase RusA-like endonuclease
MTRAFRKSLHRVEIKLSVNEAHQGRRFRTPELIAYQQELAYRLPKIEVAKGKLALRYIFGVSSKNADGDNLIKAFQDALADHYGFNDRDIYHWEVEKRIVPKGEEFVEFELCPNA